MPNILDRFQDAVARRVLRSMKTGWNTMPSWENNVPVYSDNKYAERIRSGYRKNELIYSCIRFKCLSQMMSRTVVQDAEGTILDTHPLTQLMHHPNPFMSESDFKSLTTIMLDCAGRATWEKVRNKVGLPIQLWPLNPDWLHPVRDQDVFIKGYQYKVPGVAQTASIDVNDVIEIKLWDPLDLYNGLAPVAVAGRVGDVDNAATDFIRLFFQNGGAPLGVLKTKRRLQDTQIMDARRRWTDRYGGWQNWIAPAVLDEELDYQTIGSTFKDMGFGELDARSETRLTMVLGVPPILVGAKVGLDRSTFNNSHEAELYAWNHTIIPQDIVIEEAIERSLVPDFGGNLRISHDYSRVPAMKEDLIALIGAATQAFGTGNLTRNDYRQMLHLQPWTDGDVRVLLNTQTEIPVSDVAPEEKVSIHLPDTILMSHNGHKAAAAPDDAARRRRERELQKTMESYFEGCLKRIKKEVDS